MTHRPISRFLAILAILLIALFDPDADAAAPKKKKKSTPKKKPAATRKAPAKKPAAAAPTGPVGATFQERINSLVHGSVARTAESSIQIVELDSGRVVAERNPHMALAPASNMKLFTTAAAIDLLKPTFEVTTSVFVRGEIDKSGTLNGDVKFVGKGDPTIGGRFHDGDATSILREWASDLKRAGVKNVSGNLVFEYGYMDTEYIHPSWPVDQLVAWYEAPIAAFALQEGCIAVRVLPSRAGKPCVVQLDPPTNYVSIQNTCRTGGGLPFITRHLGSNNLIVRGGVPARSGMTEVFITIENPIHYFAAVTNETLQKNGMTIGGEIVLTPHDPRQDWRLVAKHTTPLSILIYVTNKKSQNHYAEQVLKMLGAEVKKQGSWAAGNAVVMDWMTRKIGVPPAEFTPADGSGMSRDNRASANAFVTLLRYMWKSPWREEFVSSLPYTGDPDSKFGNRLRRPPFARQVYAKTGYISGVIGLSGYVHAQSGKVYAFSFLFNRYKTGVFGVYNLQDEILKEIIRSG